MKLPRPAGIALITACLVAWLTGGVAAAVLVLRQHPTHASSAADGASGLAVLAVSAYLRGDPTALGELTTAPPPDLPTGTYPGQVVVTGLHAGPDGVEVEVTAEVLRAGVEGYAHAGRETFRVRVVGDPPTVAIFRPPASGSGGRRGTTETGGRP